MILKPDILEIAYYQSQINTIANATIGYVNSLEKVLYNKEFKIIKIYKSELGLFYYLNIDLYI